jgi:mRNA interferase MazF
MISRGDIVVVDFPFTDGGSKVRPALVLQNDHDNARIEKTILALITGNLKRTGDPSHVLVDPRTSEGASSGLSGRSLVSCNNLYTIEQSDIITTLGRLSPTLLQQVNDALKAALALP